MKRRTFLNKSLAGGMMLGSGMSFGSSAAGAASPQDWNQQETDLVIERPLSGKPHKGKILAAIQPHSDDIPLFAAGTVAKLIKEGYKGYLIRTTNDEAEDPGTPRSVGEQITANERDNREVARALGLSDQTFDLNYRNHRMEDVSDIELLCRFIFLIRLLKIDTIVGYDPWGHYEENPDHYVTARAVEAACWMAGRLNDYPEHFAAGLEPHSVKEKYYFARGPQLVNRIVDISGTVEEKINSNLANKAKGPSGNKGGLLRAELAKKGLRLPLLGNDDETANREITRKFVLSGNRKLGEKYGLEYAEAYHYISGLSEENLELEAYIKENAVPIR